MAHKEIWDQETLREELYNANDALATIPNRHLKKIKRFLDLHSHLTSLSALGQTGDETDPTKIAHSHAFSQGKIMGMATLNLPVTQILVGEFKPISVNSDDMEPDDVTEQEYRAMFDEEDFDE